MPDLNTIADPQSRRFIERLSCILVVFSAIGAMLVLVDPVLTLQLGNGNTLKIGGEGFADQMKGAVLTLILVAGFTAVVQYWLGASNQGDRAQENVNKIAASAMPAGGGTGDGSQPPAPIQAQNVGIQADNVNVTEGKP